MGWNAVRNHYQITHPVHRRDCDIWVGSGYLPSALAIGPAGEIKKRYSGPDEGLSRYQHEMAGTWRSCGNWSPGRVSTAKG